jgi:hypothetical protein
MLTVVSDSADRDGSGAARSAASSVIDEIVREGARRMLAEALRAEVDAYIAQFVDVRDEKGHRLVVRNGCHESRTVTTSAGVVDVTAPRVNDKRVDPDTGERQRFSSSILPPWARKTPKIGEVLPLLYLHGCSSGDFVPALGQFLGSAKGLSASTVTKLTETWKAEQQAFAERDLSGVDFVYLWADGIHVNVRLDEQKLCLLVMIGVRADGRKELVALTDGYREAAESWADLLRDCRRRGMRAPVLAARGRGARILERAARGVPGDPRAALLVPLCRRPDYAEAGGVCAGGGRGGAAEVGIIVGSEARRFPFLSVSRRRRHGKSGSGPGDWPAGGVQQRFRGRVGSAWVSAECCGQSAAVDGAFESVDDSARFDRRWADGVCVGGFPRRTACCWLSAVVVSQGFIALGHVSARAWRGAGGAGAGARRGGGDAVCPLPRLPCA